MNARAVEGPSPISRDWRARVAIYLSVLFAYLAAGDRDSLTPFQLAIFAAAAAWSLAFEHRWTRPFFGAPLKIGLIVVGSIIFVAFIGGHLQRAPENFANAIARFLFWNAVVFILSRNKTDYDVWTLGIINVSLFMIAGAFVQPPLFLPLFVGSLASLLYGFQRLALLRCGPAGEQSRGGLGLTLAQLALVIEVAAIVFVLFPRRLFWDSPKPDVPKPPVADAPPDRPPGHTEHAKTGLSRTPGRLKIGALASVKVDPTPVLFLTVAFSATGDAVEFGRDIYLRQDVLVTYSRGDWTTSFRPVLRTAGDNGQVTRDTESIPMLVGQKVFQGIIFKPSPGMAIPAMAEVYELGIARVKIDDHGVCFFDTPLPREYRAVSYVPPENVERRLVGVTEVVEPDADYLKRPVGLEGLVKAAREIVGDRVALVDKVNALRKHFLSGAFRYTLAPPNPPPGRDVYEWFVTEGRAGYCTHYAGALALMCRGVGVPARVATGLHVGKEAWDPFNKRYIAKNSDAHAWTEVWFGREFGWIPFDATPPEGLAPPNRGAPVATGDGPKVDGPKGPEAEPTRWDEAILNFDSSLQGRARRLFFARSPPSAAGSHRSRAPSSPSWRSRS